MYHWIIQPLESQVFCYAPNPQSSVPGFAFQCLILTVTRLSDSGYSVIMVTNKTGLSKYLVFAPTRWHRIY